MPARTDLVDDRRVAEDLLLARRGTAYFSRCLAGISDAELSGPSLRPGWSRAGVVADVAYRARALAEALARVRTGEEPTELRALEPEEIAFGATLPPVALRNLHEHAAVHLSVEWRDLPADRWGRSLSRPGGDPFPVSDTPLRRAREVWVSAVDLDGTARPDDVPAAVRGATSTP